MHGWNHEPAAKPPAELASLHPLLLSNMKIAKILTVALVLSLSFHAQAVIFFNSGDPDQNTSAPTGSLAVSGWDLQGTWGGFLGTPIAPRYFISAQHVGGAVGDTFVFRGVNYTTTARFADSASDLVIWQVSRAFPEFASLYTQTDEVGKNVVVFGRGTQRGAEVNVSGLLGQVRKGWLWGPLDGRMRWGENKVDDVISASGLGFLTPGTLNPSAELLKLGFNASGGPNECHLSLGDSAGALFINDGSGWKLAGINYAVDGMYNTSNTGPGFNASIYDQGGLYKGREGSWTLTPDTPTDQPGSFYVSRISTRIAWIESVLAIVPPEDPPLLEYTDQLGSPFLTEAYAQVDTETQTIRTSITSGPRLFRINSARSLRITSISREGDSLVLSYE